MNQAPLISHYRIIRHLGSGGFGDTFLVQDIHLPSGKTCVLKQLKPINNNPQVYQLVKDRFQREAVILEDLGNNHQQIPTLYAYFEDQGNFYLVQEYIEGDTLSSLVKTQGIQSENTVKSILLKTLEILEFIETKGIIHRDIKPDNIMIRKSDQNPVLIDFGAVRETMGTELTASGNSTSSIVIGTPGFMSSEQAAGRPIFASDLYALGLTMIYLLTGKYPRELATNPVTGEIIWQQEIGNINPLLAKVLDQAIKPQASQRFPTAQAMKAALVGQSSLPTQAIFSTETTLTAPPTITEKVTKKSSNLILTIVLGSVIIGLVSSGLFLYSQQQKIQQEALRQQQELEQQRKLELQKEEQELEQQKRELEARQREIEQQNTPSIPVTKTNIWRSESGLTRLPNLDQICWGNPTINPAQTIFGYDKLPMTGTINIYAPKTGGCNVGETLSGYFDLSGNSGHCVGSIMITWQHNNNALIEWKITNVGAECRVSQADWNINTYPVSN